MPHANLTRDEAAERSAILSDLSYDIELDVTGDADTFSSRTRVRFAAEPGARTFVDLCAEEVQRASLNGKPLPPESIGETRIRLPELDERNELVVEATCAYQRSGVGLHRFTDPVDGRVYLHTQFEPFDANRVYACFDQPDLKGRFTLTVHAPKDWLVVSNGEVVASEMGTWRFAETLPIPTYITALVAGPYHVERDTWRASDGSQEVPLGLYCRSSLAQHLDSGEFFEITKQGLDYFRRAFGFPYPFGPYDQLLVPEFNWGAMENPGCITFTEQFVFRSKVTEALRQSRASTILHEMAHMWFGNLVTMRWWDDLWLNESFATYMGTRALAEATRFTDAWASFSAQIKSWAVAQDQLPSTHPISADIVDTHAVRTHFDGITYAKGASVLKQLVAWVGDDAFLSGIRDYFQRHAYGNATLTDFLAALERPSGRDLAPWSRQWLETSGVATLRPAVSESDGTMDTVEMLQEAPEEHPHVRDHRLAVGCFSVEGPALRLTRRAELDVRGQRTEVKELAGAPRPDLLLANHEDLAYAKLRLDERSIQTLLDGLDRLDDPLARALCWGAAWDMVRDAELAARRFVALVADHAHAESDVALLQVQVRRAHAAANHYGDPANRDAIRARLAAGAGKALEAAEPGSDAQLVWVKAFAAVAISDADVRWLGDLLEGETSIEGLSVDTDLRWDLLVALAREGRAGEERIAAEERRDATDMGARRAAQTRAARPDPQAKEAAWARLLDDETTTLAMRRSLCAGFWQYGQESVLGDYIDGYPEAVRRIWKERNPEEAITLTQGAYPETIVTQEVVDAAARALESEDLPASARRIVAECQDQTLRALRAREVDRAEG